MSHPFPCRARSGVTRRKERAALRGAGVDFAGAGIVLCSYETQILGRRFRRLPCRGNEERQLCRARHRLYSVYRRFSDGARAVAHAPHTGRRAGAGGSSFQGGALHQRHSHGARLRGHNNERDLADAQQAYGSFRLPVRHTRVYVGRGFHGNVHNRFDRERRVLSPPLLNNRQATVVSTRPPSRSQRNLRQNKTAENRGFSVCATQSNRCVISIAALRVPRRRRRRCPRRIPPSRLHVGMRVTPR